MAKCIDCGVVVDISDGSHHLTCPGERIETAAIRVDGVVWTLPRPARHHVLIAAWGWAHYGAKPGRIDQHDQGFVTSKGRFVDRKEGAAIAVAAKQILPRWENPPTNLTSEHLW